MKCKWSWEASYLGNLMLVERDEAMCHLSMKSERKV
jgi:hypothetical protein